MGKKSIFSIFLIFLLSNQLLALSKINKKNYTIKKIHYENKLKSKVIKMISNKKLRAGSDKVLMNLMKIVAKEKTNKKIDYFQQIKFFKKIVIAIDKKSKRMKYIEDEDFNALYIKKYKMYYVEVGKSYFFIELKDLIKNKRKIILTNPLKKVKRISSRYGYRKHPVTKRRALHNGIDLVNDKGTPIYPTAPGKIYKKGYDKKNGYYVILKHKNGVKSAYCHLQKFKNKNQSKGKVTRNTIIGYLGNTGRSTGPHLHFGIKINGKYLNPEKFINFSNKKKHKAYDVNYKYENNRKLIRNIKRSIKKFKKTIRK